ncbi:MAG TPA: hypothetical protein HA326_02270 [Thermoplasmata archaeon]|nr:hypothetical protein [Thermoplasmata archaeon]
MRDRYLFSADRKASEYRRLLEITPGHARLLTPSKAAGQVRWFVSIALALAYVAIWSWLFWFVVVGLSLAGVAPVAAWVLFGAFSVLWFVGGFLLFLWWDRRSLPLLADAPGHSLELVLLGARSFGTFQDVRARTPWGEEIHLVVDAREPRFWEAVRLLEGRAASSG